MLWRRGGYTDEAVFNITNFHIQIHCIPLEVCTERVATKLANRFVSLPPYQFCMQDGHFLCLKVTWDISKPLSCWIPLQLPVPGMVSAKIRYERLAYICYMCVRIGHTLNECSICVEGVGEVGGPQYTHGEWLYADPKKSELSAEFYPLDVSEDSDAQDSGSRHGLMHCGAEEDSQSSHGIRPAEEEGADLTQPKTIQANSAELD